MGIVKCASPRKDRRREKTDSITPDYLAWRLGQGCPMCRASLDLLRNPAGGTFWMCSKRCLALDGEVWYVSTQSEKRHALPARRIGRW